MIERKCIFALQLLTYWSRKEVYCGEIETFIVLFGGHVVWAVRHVN